MGQNPKSDGELLAEFLGTRREGAFEELVRRHHPLVFNVCVRVLGRRHDAEDAAQAVFLTLVRRAQSLRGAVSIAPWLHRVASNVSRQALRSLGRMRKREEEAANRNPEAVRVSEEWERLKPLLDSEIDALPDRFRVPLVLRHLEGRTEGEAALAMGWKVGTLSKQLTRARELLRSRLARQGVAVSGAVLGAILAPGVAAAASTAKAAALLAAGGATAWSAVSPQVGALVSGGLKAMMLAKVKVAAAVMALSVAGLGGGLAAYQTLVPQEEKDPPKSAVLPPVKSGVPELTRESFLKLHAMVRPRGKESKWLTAGIPWVTTIAEGRRKAAAEGKPMLFMSAFGAGYTDSLGAT